MAGSQKGLERLPILHVAGEVRSGSTLLARILGQLPGFVTVGELRGLWRHGVALNQDCGCGLPFWDCPFWRAVGGEAFGGWSSLNVREVLALHQGLDRPRSFRLLAGSGRGGSSERLARYSGLLERLLQAIRKVSGAEVIVDSSNVAAHALVLRSIPGADVHVVHLVRDARAVVFSRQRRKESRGREAAPSRLWTVPGSARWIVSNAMASRLASSGLPYALLRYEDLVRSPLESVRRVLAEVGLGDPGPGPVTDDGRILLDTDHMVWGSDRVRFATGEITLRLDDEWRRSMGRGRRGVVSALTFPFLKRYGYPVRSQPSPEP